MNVPLILAFLEGTMFTAELSLKKLRELNRRAMLAGVAGGVPSTRFDSATRELDRRKRKTPMDDFAQVESFLNEGLQDLVRDISDSMGTTAPMLKALQDVWPHRQWLDASSVAIVTQGFNDYSNLTGVPPQELVRKLGGTLKDIPT